MNTDTNLWILYFLSFIISVVCSLFIVRFGHRLSLMDVPNERSSHTVPTPKCGGIGLALSFIYVSFMLCMPKTFLIPGIILSIAGMSDDLKDISVKIRLLIQVVCSIIFLAGIFFYRIVPQEVYSLFLILPIFMVGTINFYNFMDGIDGLAGITGIIAFGFLAYFAYMNGKPAALIHFNISVACACAGFLLFNFPNAKVFMGDVGSILLGFLFAAMVLILTSSFLDMLCLVSFLFTFYTDEITTMAVRLKNKENIAEPHRKHLFQLFANELGAPHMKVSLSYAVIQLWVGISVICLREKGAWVIFCLLLFYFSIFSAVSYYIRKKVS